MIVLECYIYFMLYLLNVFIYFIKKLMHSHVDAISNSKGNDLLTMFKTWKIQNIIFQ